jgi:DnaJ-class molecular chaperone
MFFSRPILSKSKYNRKNPKSVKYYKILGLEPECTKKQIVKAFRKESLTEHPDKGGSADKFGKLQKAYEVLKDELSRACYDVFGEKYESEPSLNAYVQTYIKGRNVQHQVELTIKEAYAGKKLTVSTQRGGVVKQLVIEVPANTKTGDNKIFEREGEWNSEKPIPGDLQVIFKVKRCEMWEPLEDGDVICHLKVSLKDSLRKGPLKFEHADGTIFSLTFKNCIQQDKYYLIKNEGLGNGHLILKTSVNIPISLDLDGLKAYIDTEPVSFDHDKEFVVDKYFERPDTVSQQSSNGQCRQM